MIIKSFGQYLKRIFSIDLRSLALFRITLGLTILFDLIVRSMDMQAHYTDFGVLPRAALIDQFAWVGHVSLFLINGSYWGTVILFVLYAVFALLFTSGYKTKWMAIITWFFNISIQTRNPMVLQGGDILLRCALFWALFLPMGARYSIDALLNPKDDKIKETQYFSPATIALLLQIAMVYWFTVVLKTGKEWHSEGTALYYALSIDQHATPIGVWLLQFPHLLKLMTPVVIFAEAGLPFLLFAPAGFEILRIVGVFGIILMHLAFRLGLDVGYFTLVGSSTILIFLPPLFWNYFKKREHASQENEESIHAKKCWVESIVILFLFFEVMLWNCVNLPNQRWSIPKPLHTITTILRLDQWWTMFAPFPLTEDGWYVIPGKLRDGTSVDVYNHKEGEPSLEKPKWVYRTYKNDRWRKFMMNLWSKDNEGYRLHYGRYLCRQWNESAPVNKQLMSFEINYMLERTLPDYKPSTPEKNTIWKHWCFDPPKKENDS